MNEVGYSLNFGTHYEIGILSYEYGHLNDTARELLHSTLAFSILVIHPTIKGMFIKIDNYEN